MTRHSVRWRDRHGIVHQEGTLTWRITMLCSVEAYRCVQTESTVDCMTCLVRDAKR